MTDIYLIRHAEAEGNIYRRIHGHYNSRITANGYRQIAALQKRFADITVDAVYASDLFRTCETAKAIAEPKQLPIHKDARFREVQLGVWEDLNFGWLEHFEPEQMHNFNYDPYHWHAKNAETAEEYTNRLIDALTEIAGKHNGQAIAVFTHGCVSGEALKYLFGQDATKSGRCDNTAVSLLHYQDGKFTFSYLNDNSHLTPEISTLAHQLWWRGKRDFNLWFREPDAGDAPLFQNEFPPYEGHITKVAMLVEEAVGYVSYAIEGKTLSLSRMYLTEGHRYRRMGDQLLGAAIADARKKGCTRLLVGVPTQCTPAIGFFLRMGAATEQMDDAFTVFSMFIAGPDAV